MVDVDPVGLDTETDEGITLAGEILLIGGASGLPTSSALIAHLRKVGPTDRRPRPAAWLGHQAGARHSQQGAHPTRPQQERLPTTGLPNRDPLLTPDTGRARILYMTTLSLADARANLSKLVESAVTTHERFEVTRNGDRAVVVLSAEDYDALLETVDVLSRPEEVQALKEGLDDLAAGLTSPLDEVRSAMLRRGRLQS